MDRASGISKLGNDIVGLIARFLDREDIENCLLTCRDICEAFRSAKSQIAADFPEKRRRDLDRFSSFDIVWDRWSPLVASCRPHVSSDDPRTVHVSDTLVGNVDRQVEDLIASERLLSVRHDCSRAL